VRLKARRELGSKVAGLVLEAEQLHGPGNGALKHRWVIQQASKTAPQGDGPSAQFASFFGRMLLRFAIEVACATMKKLQDDVLGE
jgi:hypothetical protein